ncbi:MAG: xanthine dehydrogenase family protein subunit M [Pseudomonadota bacterium]
MRLPHFEYLAPSTVAEAIELLHSRGLDARVMAGGTDLLIKMRHAGLKLKTVISLKHIQGLNTITADKDTGLFIGATALLADVAAHPAVKEHYPTVAEAAGGTANAQVRNLGTVVGNLCNASPAADNAPTLLAMGADVHIQGPDGCRDLSLEDFFKGPGITALADAEIVTAVSAPPLPTHSGTGYISLSARGQLDCTAAGVGVRVTMDGTACKDIRIFISACGPTPIRAVKTEALIRGKELTDEVLNRAGTQVLTEIMPITDLRASADYRRKMINVLTRRAIVKAHNTAMKL